MSLTDRLLDLLEDLLDLDEGVTGPQIPLASLPDWDSVNQLRVLVRFEATLGVALDLEAFLAAETVGDLLALARAAVPATAGAEGAA